MNHNGFNQLFSRRLLGVFLAAMFIPTVHAEDSPKERPPVVLTEAAKRLHSTAIVIDGHNDLPWELRAQGGLSFTRLDISQHQPSLQTDIPRLRQGGLGAQFWSVYVPSKTANDGTALVATLEQIELIHAMIDRYSDTFELALTAQDIRRIHGEGKIASLLGVEGGHSIENSLGVLRQLYRLGARYMTLTHNDSLGWADSGTDMAKSGGLNEFGEEVIAEMNRLGMMVDLSHVSPDCMRATLRVSKAPVIFSHSSAYAVATSPRNVPDDVLKLVAKNGGVVMVNFFSGFLVPSTASRYARRLEHERELKATLDDVVKVQALLRNWDRKDPMERGTIHVVVDHIDHIVRVAGIDHVGLGSDYDGVSLLPTQLEDVSCYPNLTQALLDRGYSESDIRKILGENLLRVMERTEQVATEMAKK
jgi:membrane dipeptidase